MAQFVNPLVSKAEALKVCRSRGHFYTRHFSEVYDKKKEKHVLKNKTRIRTIEGYKQGMSCKPTGGRVVRECKVLCTRCGHVSWQDDKFDRTDDGVRISAL